LSVGHRLQASSHKERLSLREPACWRCVVDRRSSLAGKLPQRKAFAVGASLLAMCHGPQVIACRQAPTKTRGFPVGASLLAMCRGPQVIACRQAPKKTRGFSVGASLLAMCHGPQVIACRQAPTKTRGFPVGASLLAVCCGPQAIACRQAPKKTRGFPVGASLLAMCRGPQAIACRQAPTKTTGKSARSVTPLILVVAHDAPVSAFLVALDVVAVAGRAGAPCQQGRQQGVVLRVQAQALDALCGRQVAR